MPGDPKAATLGRILFVSAPILIGVVLTVMIGALWLASRQSRPATGEPAVITVRSACSAEWVEVLRARAEMIGIGELQVAEEGGDAVLRGVMPGLPDDLTAVPALLTAMGRFEVYAADAADAEPAGAPLLGRQDIEEVVFQLDITGHPYAQLDLLPTSAARAAEGAPEYLLYVLDGVVIDAWEEGPYRGEALELQPELETSREEIRVATDWTILLGGPEGPCAVSSVEAVAAGS
ncbi:MAG: hypothetical protein H6741_13780 [Alphaproteobacteria bacterium]|nr:hypothetical protein [Alphaproteobacteria bacterium]